MKKILKEVISFLDKYTVVFSGIAGSISYVLFYYYRLELLYFLLSILVIYFFNTCRHRLFFFINPSGFFSIIGYFLSIELFVMFYTQSCFLLNPVTFGLIVGIFAHLGHKYADRYLIPVEYIKSLSKQKLSFEKFINSLDKFAGFSSAIGNVIGMYLLIFGNYYISYYLLQSLPFIFIYFFNTCKHRFLFFVNPSGFFGCIGLVVSVVLLIPIGPSFKGISSYPETLLTLCSFIVLFQSIIVGFFAHLGHKWAEKRFREISMAYLNERKRCLICETEILITSDVCFKCGANQKKIEELRKKS